MYLCCQINSAGLHQQSSVGSMHAIVMKRTPAVENTTHTHIHTHTHTHTHAHIVYTHTVCSIPCKVRYAKKIIECMMILLLNGSKKMGAFVREVLGTRPDLSSIQFNSI